MEPSCAGQKRRLRAEPRIPESLARSISPPRRKRPRPSADEKTTLYRFGFQRRPAEEPSIIPDGSGAQAGAQAGAQRVKSPWQLTWIRDLPREQNQDAVTLKDLLGCPLIVECWQFNYLFDIPFVMDAFHAGTRDVVKLHVVHGFWRRDDETKAMLMDAAASFNNVRLHCAPMPEPFGTHHSKMMVLFRRDDTAQVIIHTANMIAKDWTNMTNAVWKSPLLPKDKIPSPHKQDAQDFPVGSGERFKVDLLNYMKRYDTRQATCRPLADKLVAYDFSAIRAALIASVPGRHDARDLSETTWGWAGLRRALGDVPTRPGESEIVVQISSIATLGAKDDWLQKTLFDGLSKSRDKDRPRPKFKVVFPTADEIRQSLDGYSSGASIHTKIQSAQQAKQLQYLRPILHHWASGCERGAEMAENTTRDGGRDRAAPHIKTYIRSNKSNTIDWALLTSANLSRQAWGEAVQPGSGVIRISSWEIGILVWPGLFHPNGVMISSYQTDTPDSHMVASAEASETNAGEGSCVVAIRIPYSVPLQKYGHDEVPWVATMTHAERDCKGLTW